jgi:enoyl-CoA hydratase/carnithine racemase
MTGVVLQRNEGAVRVLTMNRPEKLNALNTALTQGLLDALRAADADPAVHVVILTGAGRGFCAGADVSEFKHLTADNPQAIGARGDLTMNLHAVIPRMTTPVIGAINGFAMGGGCGLALAPDLVVAAESAKLGYPEAKRGAVAAIVMANLVRQVGRKAAFELVAVGEAITAQQAKALGMVNHVVPDAELMPHALALAAQIAGVNPDAMAATKRLFHRCADLPLGPALEAARDANVIMRGFSIRGTV